MRLSTRLNKLSSTMMQTQMISLGLNGPQFYVLRELLISGPKTIGDLSKALELSNNTVTGIIDRMERDGLVERKRDEKDCRVIWITTTDEFLRAKKVSFEQMHDRLTEELEKSFSPEQFGLLRSMLEKLIEYVEKKLESTK